MAIRKKRVTERTDEHMGTSIFSNYLSNVRQAVEHWFNNKLNVLKARPGITVGENIVVHNKAGRGNLGRFNDRYLSSVMEPGYLSRYNPNVTVTVEKEIDEHYIDQYDIVINGIRFNWRSITVDEYREEYEICLEFDIDKNNTTNEQIHVFASDKEYVDYMDLIGTIDKEHNQILVNDYAYEHIRGRGNSSVTETFKKLRYKFKAKSAPNNKFFEKVGAINDNKLYSDEYRMINN